MARDFSLDTPSTPSRMPRVNLDGDQVGRYAEKIAHFLGTGRYLAYQTIFVLAWIIINLLMVKHAWDPYPFILLNLAFSTQAAYAAPLILLAQNRQDDRDRLSLLEDRRRAEETKADTEYLARELAALRIASDETVTREVLRKEISALTEALIRLEDKLDDSHHDVHLDSHHEG